MRNNRKIKKTDTDSKELKKQLKLIGSLNRAGMNCGNSGDFDAAISNLKDAVLFSKTLDKACLNAKLLNNMGILYTQKGVWDKALLLFDQAMDLVVSQYGTQNYLYKTIQKNIGYLFK